MSIKRKEELHGVGEIDLDGVIQEGDGEVFTITRELGTEDALRHLHHFHTLHVMLKCSFKYSTPGT